jgi:serine/threonine protein phosphatase PrpC
MEQNPVSVFQTVRQYTHTVEMSESMNQLSKGQDQTYIGNFIDEKTNETVHYAIELDGHGTHDCIKKLRTMDFVPFLQMETPIEEIAKYLIKQKTVSAYTSSGACISIALIYTDRIVLLNCGDTQSALFIDDNLAYINEPHDLDRKGELEMAKEHGTFYDITQSSSIMVVSPNQIKAKSAKYIRYSTGNLLAPTRAIGHNGIISSKADRVEFKIEGGKNYRIVLASDGIFDMVIMNNPEDMSIFTKSPTAGSIVQYYSDRWLQEWNIVEEKDSILVAGGTFRFLKNECDDVSACVIDIKQGTCGSPHPSLSLFN